MPGEQDPSGGPSRELKRRRIPLSIRVLLLSVVIVIAFVAVPPAEYTRPSVVDGTESVGLAAAEPPDERLEAVHERGITGEGVKVGVIGASFGSHATLGSGVSDHATFHRSTAEPVPGTEANHGFQVASVVAGSAPDAELYLADVGHAPKPDEYRDAVEWLVKSDVDIIVDAGSYAPLDEPTRSVFGWAAEYTADADVLFVTSAGNFGNKHWSGTAVESGWVPVETTTEANQIGEGQIEGAVSLRLYWETNDRFDLYLFKHRSNAEDVVVASDERAGGAAAIDATLPRGTYYAAIHAPEQVEDRTQLRLFSLTQPLRHTEPDGSVLEPAATDSVVAVGANAPNETLRADSSRLGSTMAGPGSVETTDETIVGTSAAAPYVAGTAALVKSTDGSLSSAETRDVLSETAEQDGEAVVVDPAGAVSSLEPEANITTGGA